jgi:hypothetical protein
MKRTLLCLAALIPLAALARTASAGDENEAAFNERCATRLSIAFIGKSAAPELMASSDPKSAIDSLLKSADFHERFARFINAQFNDARGTTTMQDAPYHLAKVVLRDEKPWSDLFMGNYRLQLLFNNVAVSEDPSGQGLGYFRSDGWYTRYEGNEEKGIKIATAYRMMNNVIGLTLVASTNSPDADVSAAGRATGSCKGCHYDNWFALDNVASILSTKGRPFDDYKGGPKAILGGKMVQNDKELIAALVESKNFSFNACRLAFKYLYGRPENRCEGTIFDACVDTFESKKTIQSALAAVANDPAFCQ